MKFTEVLYKRYVKLRILATLIDYTIYSAVVVIYILCFGARNEEGSTEVSGFSALPVFLLWFLYFVGTEAINQATPGHDICKLVVVKSKGDKISFGDAFKRRILDAIDICFYGIPALICIYNTPRYQRLGDLFADTVVVRKSDIKKVEVMF
jgi:uncharacterized RDD family membrane protein YckC